MCTSYPFFKQGDRDDLNNYRLISVISVVAKVFEKIVYDQLYVMTSSVNINNGSTWGHRYLDI